MSLVSLWCTSPALASALGQGVPLVSEAQVLRGPVGSLTLPFEVGAAGLAPDAPTVLSLVVDASEVLDGVRSTVTLSVDGVPVATVPVARLVQAGEPVPWTTALPALPAGFHQLGLRAHLEVPGDPCGRLDPDAAWLNVSPATTVSGASPTPLPTGLDDLPAAWRVAGAPAHVWVDPPSGPTPEAVSALLASERLVGGWGMLADTKADATGRLVLRTLADADTVAAADVLARTPGASGVYERRGTELWVIGRSAADLAAGIDALGADEVRSTCHATPCPFGAAPPRRTVPSEDPERLAELGLSSGWTARGSGTHTLRLYWPRPVDWVVVAPPVLTLALTLPEGGPLDRDTSTLTAELDGRPLETWSLDARGGGPRLLLARIPEDRWAADGWVVTVKATLRERDEDRCDPVDDDASWLTLGPDSSLRVTREEQSFDGVSGFRRAVQGEGGTATLAFAPALTWDDWRLVARVLGSLQVDLSEASDRPRVVATAAVPGSTTTTLRAEECADGACRLLSVEVPSERHGLPATPQLRGLLGRTAWWDGSRWRSEDLDPDPAATRTHHPGPAPEAAVLPSDGARSRLGVDVVFGGLFLAVAAAAGLGLLWSARRDRASGAVDVERA